MAIQKAHTAGIAILWVTLQWNLVSGQPLSQTTLVIDLQNAVEYQQDDPSTPSKLATNPNLTPSPGLHDFGNATLLADIVAVNGQPAKGLYAGRSRVIDASPTPSAGSAIADVTRTAMREHYFEILTSDGTQIGTIMSLGFSGGPAPPGAPSTGHANWAIVGGTGAFFGARGLVAGTGGTGRAASMTEDPANRRTNGGTSFSFVLYVVPMFVPQIVSTPNGPAVTHTSDFSLVSASKPAAAGELLSLFATGLGPTVPSVDLGQPFPSSPLAAANSPVTVTVNGEAAEVLAAVGFPGSTDGYQINFMMPSDVAKGTATLQLSAAWIPAAPVTITVQ